MEPQQNLPSDSDDSDDKESSCNAGDPDSILQ